MQGYGEETDGDGVKLELRYRYATDKITHWPWPCQVRETLFGQSRIILIECPLPFTALQLHVRVPDLQATLDTAKAVNKV